MLTHCALKKALDEVYKWCLDIKRDGTELPAWDDILTHFKSYQPEYENEPIKNLLETDFLCGLEDPDSVEIDKLATFILLASNSHHESKWECFFEEPDGYASKAQVKHLVD